MNQSYWGILVVVLGVASIFLIVFFQTATNTDEHNAQTIKEVTEAAMWDAVDYAYFRQTGTVKIDKEKFVENFTRRFAETASTARQYKIEFYDVNERPPKVSIRILSDVTGNANQMLSSTADPVTVTLTDKIDAILETPY